MLGELAQVRVADSAWAMQRVISDWLRSRGFVREWDHVLRGYLDLYAYRSDVTLAIEIDRRSPRLKSLEKLPAVSVATRMVLQLGRFSTR